MQEAIILIAPAVLGLIIGSFLNVCIARLPAGQSVVRPRSRCPSCGKLIRFYDNIPVLSFLLLGGKCRACSCRISLRYPVIEVLTGALTWLFFWKWVSSPLWMAAALLAVYVLIVIAVIDLETMLIADLFSFLLGATGLAASLVNPYFHGGAADRLLASAGGLVFGAGVIWALAWLGKKIYKMDAVGEGDIFLMGGLGALLGWQGVVSTLMMGAFFGSVYGIGLLLMKKAGRRDHMPFGPFLALGGVINLYSLVSPAWFLFF
ncbi:MAG: leader peptidase (prepilin peptidase) / N-methyltransferase [Elusimicrobia bacterium]|nr:MAG: leader peptidase (prepilin peptidase) / N-methyltransferase [Elusimicrobiota bacterium]KAF0155634.1 MAG: leader peptidase (prepilin peptidase) / N-methyltransferase [Elusimicrobiota bacterium]